MRKPCVLKVLDLLDLTRQYEIQLFPGDKLSVWCHRLALSSLCQFWIGLRPLVYLSPRPTQSQGAYRSLGEVAEIPNLEAFASEPHDDRSRVAQRPAL